MNPSGVELLLVLTLFFAVAGLYSSVGHGGASGYLAVMALFSMPAAFMSSTALVLNVLVSAISLVMFWRSGYVSLGFLGPFVLGSVPAALLGGMVEVSPRVYAILLAGALLAAAIRLSMRLNGSTREPETDRRMRATTAPLIGAGVGLLSGIIGIGGGIFLGPVLLLMRWANAKQTAGICAGFILVNSVAGLAGRMIQGGLNIGANVYFLVAAFAGGIIGSYLGAKKLPSARLRRILALLLLVAAVKLLVAAH